MGKVGPIEDNIPVPENARIERNSIYPWGKIKVGQSFLVELEYDEDIKKMKERIRTAALQRIRKTQNKEDYVTKIEYFNEAAENDNKVPRGVRVWRTK